MKRAKTRLLLSPWGIGRIICFGISLALLILSISLHLLDGKQRILAAIALFPFLMAIFGPSPTTRRKYNQDLESNE